MRITAVESTELFTGTLQRPAQIVRVTVAGDGDGDGDGDSGVAVRIEGPAVTTPRPAVATAPRRGGEQAVEVGVELAAPAAEGSRRRATVIAEQVPGPGRPGRRRAEAPADIIAAVPGWTMWMVSHFHYDPVWWNTQGQFTESRLLLPDEHGKLPEFRTAFELVGLHLDMAREDPDYKFVLAEVDYLKPYFDTHPHRREELRRLLREGRVEIVGGNYNEANTNLTCAEATIRNAVYGIGYQRDVIGGDPATAWMLDVFGHDPSYPSLMAAAGLTSSAWARGPFHQWGPRGTVGDNTRMQFPSEFEWVSPDGRGLLTAYMPNHYGAGWAMERQADLAAAEREAYAQFLSLKPVAATRNVLLPVGADHVIPSHWSTRVHRAFGARYLWPRFVTAVPGEFFAAVRADAATRDVAFTPQTRDMNPVYPGKDVSYIDTKQAQRAAETAVMDAERLATLAWLHGAPYPEVALDKAWRLLIYGAHHDAITGTESDQVYLDLLGGWREAWERGEGARRDAAGYLASLADTGWRPAPGGGEGGDGPDRAVVVFNSLAAPRDAMVTVTLRCARPGTGWLELRDSDGAPVAALADGVRRHPGGTLAEVTLTFRARRVPGLGYRTYWARPSAGGAHASTAAWAAVPGTAIANAAYLVEADPRRGGTLTRVRDKRAGVELITPGAGGNELVVQPEYDYHPRWTEGPWLLTPKGPGTGSATVGAQVQAQRCPAGSRLVATWTLACGQDALRVTQETLLWDGEPRIAFRTHVDGSIGHDRLLRVRFPLSVPGGLPVYETAAAVIGRPFGATDTDVAEHWFTLDNPAYTWFGLGSTARVVISETSGGSRGGAAHGPSRAEALGVAEVISPNMPGGCHEEIRGLIAALAQQGVTATCSRAGGPRYGAIDVDSNLPDVRICVGGPEVNSFAAEVLAQAGPACATTLSERLASDGTVRLWVPAARARAAAFAPGADVRGARDLPVLIVAGADASRLAAAVRAAAGAVAAAELDAVSPPRAAASAAHPPTAAPLADWSAALLNRGTPGCVATTDGTLNISLMRSCSGWPSGVWIDGPKRTAPDGSSFSWQHWSHTFDYALASGRGDWRDAGFSPAGQDYNHPLLACETSLHPGPLPATASLLEIETSGPGAVTLGALKRRGNPGAAGHPARTAPSPRSGHGQADVITVRLRECTGRPAHARLRAGPAGQPQLTGWHTSLLEEPEEPEEPEEQAGTALAAAGGALLASLPPFGTVTLAARTGPAPPRAQHDAAEAAQPVFTRYWLHGKGPAPAGGLPTAVHVFPAKNATPAGGDVRLRVTVAAGAGAASGNVELDVPGGFTAHPAGPLRYDLPAGGHCGWEVRVRAAGPAGRYFVAARIAGEAGQALEDVATIAVGERPVPPRDTPLDQLLPLIAADQRATAAELEVTPAVRALTLSPGERAQLVIGLACRARSPIRGEASLLSPYGTWEALAPWTQGFSVEPGGQARLCYQVAMPATARPGAGWWALVKVCYFGRVHYTRATQISVRAASTMPSSKTPATARSGTAAHRAK